MRSQGRCTSTLGSLQHTQLRLPPSIWLAIACSSHRRTCSSVASICRVFPVAGLQRGFSVESPATGQMSLYTDMTLEPLQLEEEFDAEQQEPDRPPHPQEAEAPPPPGAADSSAASALLTSPNDDLRLKSDPHLARFFATIEGHHLPMREVLLLSCHAHLRTISPAFFHESRRPVVQGRRRNKEERARAREEQRRKEEARARRKSDSAAGATGSPATAAAAAATSGAVHQPPHSNGVAAPSAAEVPGVPPAKPGFWQRIRTPERTPSPKLGIGAGVVGQQPATTAPHGGLSTSPPPPVSKSARMAEWFRKKVGSDDKQLTSQHQALPRHSPSLLLNESSPPPYALQSPTFSYNGARTQPTIAAATQTRSRNGSAVISPEVTKTTSQPSPSHQMSTAEERAARAPQAEPPQPCTLVLTNLALYVFPPAIPIELDSDPSSPVSSPGGTKQTKHFLVYTEYQRIALQDILLVSLPYRSGLTRHGTDFALRITDFALHLRDGDTTVWLQAPRNKRSRVVECISDAYSNLMGLPIEMTQPDYSELLYDILSKNIWTQIREMQIQKWALGKPIQAGYLFHRSLHVWPSLVDAPNGANSASSSAQPQKIEMKMSAPSDWRRQWFVLSRDNYLLHFTSKEELDAFQYVASSNNLSGASGKFPASFDCNQIDLSKSLYLRGSSVCPDGFEIIVYPRASSMQSGSAHEHGTAATLEYGYTRHLFQIPLPAVPSTTGVQLVGSKTHPAASTTERSPQLHAYMDTQVSAWLTALRQAMGGAGLSGERSRRGSESALAMGGAALVGEVRERRRRDSEVDLVKQGDDAAVAALGAKTNRFSGTFGAGTPAAMRDATLSLKLQSFNEEAAPASFTVIGHGNVEDDEIAVILMSPTPSPDPMSPQPISSSASPPPLPPRRFLDTSASPPAPTVGSPDGPAMDSLMIKPPNFREEPQQSPLSPNLETPQLP